MAADKIRCQHCGRWCSADPWNRTTYRYKRFCGEHENRACYRERMNRARRMQRHKKFLKERYKEFRSL